MKKGDIIGLIIVTVFFFGMIAWDAYGEEITMATWKRSYYALDDNGKMATINGLPYKQEGIYSFVRTFIPKETAIIVCDPWVDMVPQDLNDYFSPVLNNRILPLIDKAIDLDMSVIVTSNKLGAYRYTCTLHPKIHELIKHGKIGLLTYERLTADDAVAYFKQIGLKNLIYCGFASNMCLIGRATGLIAMQGKGFNLYYIPDASAAVEFGNTWEYDTIHAHMTIIISQWIAQIIDYHEIMGAHEND